MITTTHSHKHWTNKGGHVKGKRRFGLGLIREKLPATQGSTIELDVLMMNLEKLLELLFVFFAYWLQLLLGNESGKGSRFAHLNNQVAPA